MTDLSPIGAIPAAAADETAPPPAAAVRHDTPLAMAAGALWMRELRARMRGKRAFVFVTFYLSLLVGLLWLALRTMDQQHLGALEQMAVGRGIFAAVVMIVTLVVVALAPAYTAGSISQEREKQTFDLLAVTPVTSLSIVIGKLLSGLSYLALLAGVSIPLASVAFLFGGVEPETIVVAYVIVAVAAVGVGAIGVACSAVMRRTQAATVAAFLLTGVIVVGATVGWAVYGGLAADRELDPPPDALLYLNPFLAQSDLLCASTANLCMVGVTIAADEVQDGQWLQPQQMAELSGGFWPKSILAWTVMTVVSVFVATQAVAPTRRWRPGRRAARPTEPMP